MENEKIIKKTLADSISVLREYENYYEQYTRVLVRLAIPQDIIDLYLKEVNSSDK